MLLATQVSCCQIYRVVAGGLDCGNEFDELVPDIDLKKISSSVSLPVSNGADKAGVAYGCATVRCELEFQSCQCQVQSTQDPFIDTRARNMKNCSWDVDGSRRW